MFDETAQPSNQSSKELIQGLASQYPQLQKFFDRTLTTMSKGEKQVDAKVRQAVEVSARQLISRIQTIPETILAQIQTPEELIKALNDFRPAGEKTYLNIRDRFAIYTTLEKRLTTKEITKIYFNYEEVPPDEISPFFAGSNYWDNPPSLELNQKLADSGLQYPLLSGENVIPITYLYKSVDK